MPLVIHTSSCCDVCLEGYTLRSTKTSRSVVPGAIPCGHIFCMSCLYTVNPPICPLCRTRYAADRVKKIHIDLMEPADDVVEDLELLTAMLDTALNPTNSLKAAIDRSIQKRGNTSKVPLNKTKQVLSNYILVDNWRTIKERHIEEMEKRLESAETESILANNRISQITPSGPKHRHGSRAKKIAELEQTVIALQQQLSHTQNSFLDSPKESQTVPQYIIPNALPPPPSISTGFSHSTGSVSSSSKASSSLIDPDAVPRSSRSRRTDYQPYAEPLTDGDDILVASNSHSIIPGPPPSDRFMPAAVTPDTDAFSRVQNVSAYVAGFSQGNREGYNFVQSTRGPDPSTGYIPSGNLVNAGYPQCPVAPVTESDIGSPVSFATAPSTNSLAQSQASSSSIRNSHITLPSVNSSVTWGTVSDGSVTMAGLNLNSFPQIAPHTQPPHIAPHIVPNPMQSHLRIIPEDRNSRTPNSSGSGTMYSDTVSTSSRRSRDSTGTGSSSQEIQSESESMSTSSSARRHRRHHRQHRGHSSLGHQAFDSSFQPTETNALGLDLSSDNTPNYNEVNIHAPAPISSHVPFLREFSDGPTLR